MSTESKKRAEQFAALLSEGHKLTDAWKKVFPEAAVGLSEAPLRFVAGMYQKTPEAKAAIARASERIASRKDKAPREDRAVFRIWQELRKMMETMTTVAGQCRNHTLSLEELRSHMMAEADVLAKEKTLEEVREITGGLVHHLDALPAEVTRCLGIQQVAAKEIEALRHDLAMHYSVQRQLVEALQNLRELAGLKEELRSQVGENLDIQRQLTAELADLKELKDLKGELFGAIQRLDAARFARDAAPAQEQINGPCA